MQKLELTNFPKKSSESFENWNCEKVKDVQGWHKKFSDGEGVDYSIGGS